MVTMALKIYIGVVSDCSLLKKYNLLKSPTNPVFIDSLTSVLINS